MAQTKLKLFVATKMVIPKSIKSRDLGSEKIGKGTLKPTLSGGVRKQGQLRNMIFAWLLLAPLQAVLHFLWVENQLFPKKLKPKE